MYISIDVGGTNTRVAGATDINKPVFVSEPLRRKNTHDFEDDLNFMIEAARKIADGQQIKAVGIGTPGSPNEDKTSIKSAQNLSSWAGKPLVASLAAALGCPVFYDTDVVAASLGEVCYGDITGNFDYIVWGTGIGGATLSYDNNQPEVTVVNWRENFEAWERDCGGAALTKTFDQPPETFTDAEWAKVAKLFRRHLETYIHNNKPPAIVFGGGLAVKHKNLIREAGQSLGVDVTVTPFGGDSGLMGGFGLIKSNLS